MSVNFSGFSDADFNCLKAVLDTYNLQNAATQSLDVAVLHLDYHESKRTGGFGNQFRYRAKVDDDRKARVGRWAWDVFLVSRQ